MAAGHYGEHGPRAQRLVGLEAKHVTELVPIPRQSTEECALDPAFKQRLVWSKTALVSGQCFFVIHDCMSRQFNNQNLHGKNKPK